jgi:mannosyltransferase OCH1-like enzyme
MHIPRIIHNIWIQGYDQLSEDIREKRLKIKKINPNWDFIIWDERMIKEVVKEY